MCGSMVKCPTKFIKYLRQKRNSQNKQNNECVTILAHGVLSWMNFM